MKKEKIVLKGLGDIATKLEIIEKLEKGKKVKGFYLCPACNGSGWGENQENQFEYCKVCYGEGLLSERKFKKLVKR